MEVPNPWRIFLLYLPDCSWGPRWNYSGSPLLALGRGRYLNLQGRYYQIPRCIFFAAKSLNTFQITRCYQPLLSTLQVCATTYEQSLLLSEVVQQHPREKSALQLQVIMLLCQPAKKSLRLKKQPPSLLPRIVTLSHLLSASSVRCQFGWVFINKLSSNYFCKVLWGNESAPLLNSKSILYSGFLISTKSPIPLPS